MPFVTSGSRRGGKALAALIGIALLAAAPAEAKNAANNPDLCAAQPAFARPFTAFGDSGDYTLVDGGDMESELRGWKLSHGARIVEGNAPFNVGSPTDDHSLSLASGATVQTAPICIDQTYPWLRLFARNTSNIAGVPAELKVDILYTDVKGKTVRKSSGTEVGMGAWKLSNRLQIKAVFDAAIADGAAPVVISFTAPSGTSWLLDDIYVDPRARG